VRITRLHIVFSWLLIFAIIVIIIAPSVNLDPTTLSSQQAAVLAMAALAAAGNALAAVVVPMWAMVLDRLFEKATAHLSSLLDLLCTRLC
jgi:hypothetical protein